MTDTTKRNGDRDRQDLGLRYYVLPDDPLAALNILREAAGLEPQHAEPDNEGTVSQPPGRKPAP